MTIDVKALVAEFREKKVSQLVGVRLDLQYWTAIRGTVDIGELRAELSKEKEKVALDKKGNMLEDGRDTNKIATLEKQINDISEAEYKINELRELEGKLKLYVQHIDKIQPEQVQELEDIAKI